MANLPADLPTNWTQGQTVSPNGTEVGLTKQHGYNYLNQQVNATQTKVNNLSTEVSGAASQTSVDNIASTIGTTTDSGATSTTGTLMGKANAILKGLDSLQLSAIKSIQRGTFLLSSGYKGKTTINISTVNADKSIVLLNGSGPSNTSSTYKETYSIYLVNLTSNSFSVGTSDDSSGAKVPFSWQVVEFY